MPISKTGEMPISVKTNTSNSYKVLWNKCINKLYYPIKTILVTEIKRAFIKMLCLKEDKYSCIICYVRRQDHPPVIECANKWQVAKVFE